MFHRRRVVQWSPHDPSEFIYGYSDLRLYKVLTFRGVSTSNTNSDVVGAPSNVHKQTSQLILERINFELNQIRSIDWCPDASTPHLVGIGLASGSLAVTSLEPQHTDSDGGLLEATAETTVIKEFSPRFSRPANIVKWNPLRANHIAVGLNKLRNDFCVLVWDVHASTEGSSTVANSSSSTGYITPPTNELAISEATMSLSWVPQQPSCLAVGTGYKWLRIYDLRSSSGSVLGFVAHPKSVNGVTFDPFFDHRVATFSEDGSIKIWDLRMVPSNYGYDSRSDESKTWDPTCLIDSKDRICQIEWSPLTKGLLASLAENRSDICLWNISDSLTTVQDITLPTVNIERPARVHLTTEPISCMCWHPRVKDRIITVTAASGVLEDVRFHYASAVDFSPIGDVACTDSLSVSIIQWNNSAVGSSDFINDGGIAAWNGGNDINNTTSIRARAIAGYSLDPENNISILEKELSSQETRQTAAPLLIGLWEWVKRCKNVTIPLQTSAASPQLPASGLYGATQLLFSQTIPSEKNVISSGVSHSTSSFDPLISYSSPERDCVLQLCGWGFAACSDPATKSHCRESLVSHSNRLEMENDYEKAAALSIFCGDIGGAIQVLSRGAETRKSQFSKESDDLSLIAMALAGYSPESHNVLWRSTCSKMVNDIRDSYLQAAFSFLCSVTRGGSKGTTTSGTFVDYSTILWDSRIALLDRVAIGCRLLPDNDLVNYISATATVAVAHGDLRGLPLTGLFSAGVDLLAQYVGVTGDVQTVALLLSAANSIGFPGLASDSRFSAFIYEYRNLLNILQLWSQRCQFDIDRVTTVASGADMSRVPSQLFARCRYCNHPLSNALMAKKGKTAVASGQTTDGPQVKYQMPCCPNCRKPLPRCSLCLMHMGVSLALPSSGAPGIASVCGDPTNVDEWFTWCQFCRHGGHSKHVLHWFSRHSVCPVMDCECECGSRESTLINKK